MYNSSFHRFRNVILTGMPCSGKTTFGRFFSFFSGRQFLDFDAYLERINNKSIKDLFQDEGEEAFRQKEFRCLRRLEKRHDTVLSMGGGTLCTGYNMKFARNLGIVVFLRTPLPILVERIFANKDTRPMFSLMQSKEEIAEKVQALWEERNSFYESSDIILDTTYSSLDCLALELTAYERKTFSRPHQREIASVTGGMPHWRNVQGSYLEHPPKIENPENASSFNQDDEHNSSNNSDFPEEENTDNSNPGLASINFPEQN